MPAQPSAARVKNWNAWRERLHVNENDGAQRERERQTDRQTDRQRDRETERQTERTDRTIMTDREDG